MPEILYDHIIDVWGLKSHSASTTDQWIIKTEKNGATKCIFLKWHMIPDEGCESNKEEIKSLDYEALVYDFVTKELIQKDVCKNFVGLCFYSEKVSVDVLRKILKRSKRVKKEDQEAALRRSFFYQFMKPKERPAIQEPFNSSNEKCYPPPNPHIGFIATKAISPKTMDLATYLEKRKEAYLKMKLENPRQNTALNPNDLLMIIFQIVFACYAMGTVGMVHNDLHPGNIWCEHVKNGVTLSYKFFGETISFTTEYVVKIYDFDRSYVRHLADNPLLNQKKGPCMYSQCNKFIPNLDTVKVLNYVYNFIPRELELTLKSDIIQALCANHQSVETLKNYYNESQRNENNLFLIGLKDLGLSLYDPNVILTNFGDLLKSYKIAPSSSSTTVVMGDIQKWPSRKKRSNDSNGGDPNPNPKRARVEEAARRQQEQRMQRMREEAVARERARVEEEARRQQEQRMQRMREEAAARERARVEEAARRQQEQRMREEAAARERARVEEEARRQQEQQEQRNPNLNRNEGFACINRYNSKTHWKMKKNSCQKKKRNEVGSDKELFPNKQLCTETCQELSGLTP